MSDEVAPSADTGAQAPVSVGADMAPDGGIAVAASSPQGLPAVAQEPTGDGAPAPRAGREILDSVFARMDRKATAIAELTLRQYRTRASTWTVLLSGLVIVSLVLLIYVDGMREPVEPFDQDGDSFDHDGDGWVTGQELALGTDPNRAFDHPNPTTDPPDPPSMWIDEDGFEWEGNRITMGSVDDDGDCNPEEWGPGERNFDRDGDGDPCGMTLELQLDGSEQLVRDHWVNEDPDDERLGKELLHRGVVVGMGKLLFMFLMGIFLPLFLATPLVRDEVERSTIHYLAGKPLARGELLAYRLLGFIALTWPAVGVLVVIAALVTGFVGSGDAFYRFSDLGVWFGILLGTWLLLLAYGLLFATFGVIHRMGVVAAIIVGLWELMMGLVGLSAPGATVVRLSFIYWAFQLVDAAAQMAWSDQGVLLAAMNHFDGSLATGSTSLFWNEPAVFGSGWVSALGSTGVLIAVAAMIFWIGQAIFRTKELA